MKADAKRVDGAATRRNCKYGASLSSLSHRIAVLPRYRVFLHLCISAVSAF